MATGPFSVTRNWPLPVSLSGVIVTHEAVTLVTLVTLGSGDGGNEPVTLVTLGSSDWGMRL